MTISEDFLLTIAEIAIALIGFSGVVTILGRRGEGSWEPAEILQLRTQVEPSATALFGAFVPSTLALIVTDFDLLWRLSNGLLLFFIVLSFGAYLARTRKAPTVLGQRIMTVVAITVQLALLSSVFGLTQEYQFTFVLGLLLGITVGVHNFSLLLFRVEEDAT